MITNKKAIDALYGRLPRDKVAGIEARDKKEYQVGDDEGFARG